MESLQASSTKDCYLSKIDVSLRITVKKVTNWYLQVSEYYREHTDFSVTLVPAVHANCHSEIDSVI